MFTLKLKMKKETQVTQDKTQTRATIPKVFVEEFNITKKNKVEWYNSNGELKAKLKGGNKK